MRLLVLEQNDIVSRIYQNIFNEKNYHADFVKDDVECLEKIEENYDYVVVDSPESDFQGSLNSKIREIKPSQRIFSLYPYLDVNSSSKYKETQEIIEKPFALLAMVAKLESEIVYTK